MGDTHEKPSDPGRMSPARHEPDQPVAAAGPPGPDERLGPVAIARHRKADGRALILYAVDRQPRA